MRAHGVDHVHHVDRCYVDLLFLGRERPLCRLQSLLFVLLFFGSLFRVFAHRTLVRVPEENRLLFRCLVVHLSFLVFFDEDAIDSLVNSLRSCLLKVFFFTIAFEIQNVFEKWIENSFAFLLLGLLDFDVITCIFDVWKHPVINVFRPLGSFLNAHVFVGGNKLVNDQVLFADVTRQFPYPFHEVLTLPMNNLLHVIELSLYRGFLIDDFLNFKRLDLKFFLLTLEMRLKRDFFFLLLFELLCNSNLLSSFFFQGTLCLE